MPRIDVARITLGSWRGGRGVLERPDTDVYAITWSGDYVLVKHFPTRRAIEPCCRIGAERADGESDGDVLARAYVLVLANHEPISRADHPVLVADDPDGDPPW